MYEDGGFVHFRTNIGWLKPGVNHINPKSERACKKETINVEIIKLIDRFVFLARITLPTLDNNTF